jgi:hypothetical protein
VGAESLRSPWLDRLLELAGLSPAIGCWRSVPSGAAAPRRLIWPLADLWRSRTLPAGQTE